MSFPAATFRATCRGVSWLTIRDDVALTAIAPQWRCLAERQAAGRCVKPEWVTAWRETIAPHVRPRVLTAWSECGKLLALWQLGMSRSGSGLSRHRVLEPMGAHVASGDRLD